MTTSNPHLTILDLAPSATKSLLLLILLADTPLPPVKSKYGDYHDIFSTLFQNSLKQLAHSSDCAQNNSKPHFANNKDAEAESKGNFKLTIESYDAVRGEYPTDERLKEADGLLITGSASSAYTPLPWITKLVSYTSQIPILNPTLKLIGICFGHQIIARAFGSTVEKNDKGWEIGVRNIQLTQVGEAVFGAGTGQEALESRGVLTLHQMHRDHVPTLPPGFELLGSTDVCPIHGMVRFKSPISTNSSSSSPSPSLSILNTIDILTVQGHPEFSPDIVSTIIDVRERGEIISHELADESRVYAVERDEGIAVVGTLCLRLIGVES